jgi:chorismate mutase-like protein
MNLLKKREEIDKIDKELLKVLSKRMEIIKDISKIKKQQKIPVLQKKRIETMLKDRRKLAEKYKLNPDFIEKLYKGLIEESMRIEETIIRP